MHLVEVDLRTGTIVGEWKNETGMTPPVAPEGRRFVDVTEMGVDLMVLPMTHRFDGESLVSKTTSA